MKMDILFTGGAIPEKSIQPLNLIKARSKYGGREEGDSCPWRATTSKYSEKVLVGNWYEERTVCPARSSGEWTTDYVESYKAHEAKNLMEDLYINWKNKQKIQDGGIKGATDGESYIDNMASSYDLNFRILPRGLCGPRKRVYSRRHVWEPEADLTLSYGNATKYGLVDIVKAKQRNEGLPPPFKSSYQLDYVDQSTRRDPNDKRFLKPRGDTTTPDLRHLGIDLSSRPITREPRYRDSRCEKVCTWL